jgi:hypothetical protein
MYIKIIFINITLKELHNNVKLKTFINTNKLD